MGEQPGKYWDHRECRWVPYVETTAVVPAPADPADDLVTEGEEADVVSG